MKINSIPGGVTAAAGFRAACCAAGSSGTGSGAVASGSSSAESSPSIAGVEPSSL